VTPDAPNELPDHPDDPASRADEQALDDLLATARWPEPSPASEQRLRDTWESIGAWQQRPRTRKWQWVAACGLASAVALAAIFLPRRTTTLEPAPRTIVQRPVIPETHPKVVESTPTPPSPVVWRPPTLWETALIHPRRTLTPTPRLPAAARPDSLIARVDAAIGALASTPGAGPAALADQLTKDFPPDRVEQRLTPVIVGRPTPQRPGAVRLLARVATPRSAPLLASLAANPADRADAVAGLLRVGDVPTLAALASFPADESERRRLLAALLRRDPARSVPAYLAFLADPATSAAALAALDDVPAPPVDTLFASLNDPRRANRLAAARALGRIDGPVVTARLAAMVRRNVNRHEALAALASSDGPEAKAFFERALASKELGAYARTARAGLDQL
jgi:hypothetical protein